MDLCESRGPFLGSTTKTCKSFTQLMVVYVFLITILVHIPRAAAPVNPVTMTGGEMDMVNVFRNVMVIGALLVFAKTSTKDVRGALV